MRKRIIRIIATLTMIAIMLPVSSFAFDFGCFINNKKEDEKTFVKQDVLIAQGRSKDDKSVNLTWNAIDGAESYCVYGALSGKEFAKIKSTTARKLQVKKLQGKKLTTHKVYKFYVSALDAEGQQIVKSRNAYVIVGKTKGKYANATNISTDSDFRIMNLHSEITPKVYVNVYKDKKHLGNGYCPKLRYTSDCPDIASVDSNGRITANNEGEATIYIQDTSGICATIEIWVNKIIRLNGVAYNLNDDWVYDDMWYTITNKNNPDAVYSIEAYFGESCSSYEERLASFAPDGSDGFEISTIKINGQKALLVAEPVNEIMDYNIFFYENGYEHIINYQTEFGNNDIEEYTQALLKLITWEEE